MAWCEGQVKWYSIVSQRGQAPSHGKDFSSGVHPPSSLFLFSRLDVEWTLFSIIFSFHMRLYTVYSWDEFFEPQCWHFHMFREINTLMERAGGRRLSRISFPQKSPCPTFAMANTCYHRAFWHNSLFCERKGEWCAQCGKTTPSQLEGCMMGTLILW